MNSTIKKSWSVRNILTTAAVLAATSGVAQAALLASPPLPINSNQNYGCAVANIGTRAIDVEVEVVIDGGGYGSKVTCQALAPSAVCVANNDAGFFDQRYCTVKTTSKKTVRGNFCNNATGACVPVQ